MRGKLERSIVRLLVDTAGGIGDDQEDSVAVNAVLRGLVVFANVRGFEWRLLT
jgi:hypothetical protein